MKPVPGSHEVSERLAAAFGGEGLEDGLQEATARLAELVPGLVGVSISLMEHGITVTYVASDPELAALDGVQYLDGGPCVAAAEAGESVGYSSDGPLDEARWQLFARAGAAAGVASTLSLPIMDGGKVIAGVNLYGARPDTFEGRREQLARLFGAWAPGAVANADLAFETRREAARAPERLNDLEVIDQAVRVLMARERIRARHARARLEAAAVSAGVPVVALARAVVTGGEAG